LRGVEAELHGSLVRLLPEAGEQVADLLLAVGEDAAGGCLVDGVGDGAAELLELAAQAGDQFVGGGLRRGVLRAPGVSGGGSPESRALPPFL
jgi:hypothetical protein